MILGTLYIGLTEACARMAAPITEGLTGSELRLKFESAAWNGLTKRVFFRAGGISCSTLIKGDTVVIPWEVTGKSGKAVQAGVIGTDGENVIIPTVWTFLGNVRPAAEETDQETLDPTLPVWAQIQKQMNDLEARANAGEFDGDPGPQGKSGADGGYYTPTVTTPDASTIQFGFTPSGGAMPAVEPVQITLPAGGGTGSGEDGFSPIATVTQSDSGAVISITDANGTTTATITNGKDGADGQPGKDGYTPQKGIDYFDGQPGKDGVDGKDGYTPVKGVDYFDGKDGSPGADGYTPVKGVDYYTDEDKAEMVEAVRVSMDGVPDYWKTHIDGKVALIREAMQTAGFNKSAFFFYSDSHWSNEKTYTAKLAPALLKYLNKNTPINKTNFGGDIVSAEADDAETMAYLWEWRNLLYGLPNHHSVPGNHDDGNTTNNLFSESYVYGYLLAPEETADIVRGDGGMYYYIDNPAEKTRYLYLDTAYQGVTTEEQAFVKSALLSTPENWHIVAIAHAWYANDYTTYPPVLNGFDSNAKILLDMFDSYNARSGEFAECLGWVEFCVGGHYHLDHIEHTNGGIPVIIVEADCLHDRSGTMPTAGTTDEAAVSAVIADYNEKTVKIIRVGRGEDLETTINVRTVSYTNVIPISIDSTGAIFNDGKGWAANSRIGSGKLESYIGSSTFYTTGHIEIDPNIDNVIRLRNITFNSTATDTKIGIAFYDSDFARVYPMSTVNSNWFQPSALTDTNGYAPVFDGTNIVQFTLKNGIHIDNTEVKYIAFCAEYIGDDSIITVNEPIE